MSIILAAAVAATGLQAHSLLAAGPMPAYAEMTETAIWVQTKRPAKVRIAYRPVERMVYPENSPSGWQPVNGKWSDSATIDASAKNDHIALVKLSELPVGTKFEYRLFLNGQEVRRDYPLRFQTQPHWRWAKNPAEPPKFRFAFGSCSYINKAETDRPGRPYGGDYEIFESIRRANPDFMIWLGDNVYYREMDWLAESEMRNRWRYDRSFAPLQALLGSVHHYGTWDDHDFGPNDSDRSFRLRDAALRVFNDYFPSQTRGVDEAKGVFTRFEWGDVEVFMLDGRYHRSPNRTPNDDPSKQIFGKEQVQWLKDSLLSSNATFKVVVSGGQMINPIGTYEAFGNAPAEQKDLFDFIAKNDVRGLLFLSGDRHHTELLKVQWPGAKYPWYEYTSSPLGSGGSRQEREANNPARVDGTWITGGIRNFGLIEVDGPRGGRVLTLTAHDKDGKEVWRHRIAETELR